MRKSMSKRLIAIVILTTVVTGSVVPTASANTIKKDESVYVTLNTDGSEKSKTVSNWLHSDDENVMVKDKTSLTDIKNVKGLEKPEQSGENVTWDMKENDLYYQGKTDKPLPVGVNIRYFLDGTEMSAEDIAGKSGNISIKIKFNNKVFENKRIGGKYRNIYLPIMVAGEVSLPLEHFTDVSINGGKIISEGKDSIASFVAMPGIKSTLELEDLDKSLADDIHDEIEIKANCKDFELGSMMMAGTTMMPEIDTIKAADTVDELKDSLKKLKDASDKLLDGTNKLKDGTDSAMIKLGDAKSMMNDPKIREKLDLLMIDNNVTRANKLIIDAMYAKDLDTSKIEEIMKLLNNDNYEAAAKIIKDAKELEQYKGDTEQAVKAFKEVLDSDSTEKLITDLKIAKASYDNITPETKKKLETLGEAVNVENIKLAQDLLQKTIVAKGQADNLLSHKDELVGGIKDFESNSEKLITNANTTLSETGDFLNSAKTTFEGVNSLMTEANKLKPSIDTFISDANSLETSYNDIISNIMKATGSKTPEEALQKIDKMIQGLNSSMDTIDGLMTEVNEFYNNEDSFKAMMNDVNDYGKAYMILKGYIAYEIQSKVANGISPDKAFTESILNAKAIISGVYGPKASDNEATKAQKNALTAELNSLIDNWAKNPNGFNEQGIMSDAVKINGYKAQIDGLISKIDGSKDKVQGLSTQLTQIKNVMPLIEEAKPILVQAQKILKEGMDLKTSATPLIQKAGPLLENTGKFLESAQATLDDANGLKSQSESFMNQASNLKSNIEGLYNSDDAKGVISYASSLQKIEENADKAFIEKLAKTFMSLNDSELNSLDETKTKALIVLQDVKASEESIKNIEELITSIHKSGKDEQIIASVKQFASDLSSTKALISQVENIVGNANITDLDKVKEMSTNLLNMQKDLKNSEDILNVTKDALSKGNVAQARSLVNGLPTLENGIKQLADGITQLNDGMKEFSEEGINKLNDKGNDAASDVNDLISVKNEMVKLSKDYDTFTGKGENMESSVKFIMKTSEIKAPEKKVEKVISKTNTEKKGFWEWLKSLFSWL